MGGASNISRMYLSVSCATGEILTTRHTRVVTVGGRGGEATTGLQSSENIYYLGIS